MISKKQFLPGGWLNREKGGEQMGEKIKKRRMELGLSQEDLAKKAGVSRVQISNLERGASQFCTWKTMQKLSKALEVAPNYFFV